MKVEALHRWDVSPTEARRIQTELAPQVALQDEFELDRLRLVAGVDNTYVTEGEETTAYAVVVALSYPEMEIVETSFAARPVSFPYVPGLLSFREGPAVLAACEELVVEPEAVLFDGQGYAHPRRLGLASHLGLFLDRPAIGCAKSRLVGRNEEPAREFGARTPLVDRGETVGTAVRTRPRHAPLFVSPGHKVSVEGAVALALACCREGRFMPEPTRLAHELVTEYARPHRERAKAT